MMPFDSDPIKPFREIRDYLYGWKGLANFFEINVRTLQRWHKISPIPWERGFYFDRIRVRIHQEEAEGYAEKMSR